VAREQELYEPFADWVRSTLEGTFVHVAVTGARRRQKGAGTKWSQPDVTAVTVANFEYLPGASVEAWTYEIKRLNEAGKIESVYEAAAHGRWAHRASLVVESFPDEEPVSTSVMGEVARLGLGLYVISHRRDGSGFSPRELLQPEAREPDRENVDELLRDFFRDEEESRQQYRQAIGR
jgi:hypothetical protein